MAKEKLPVIKINETLILKEKEYGWAPDKSNLNLLASCGYFLGDTLGEGKFSKVKRAFCERLKEVVAIKVIYKSRLQPSDKEKFVSREIEMLRTLEHPALLDIIQILECKQKYYIVMEVAQNGDLTDFINKVGSLDEADSRRLFKQLLDVVHYLHKNDICHRDIKCDNILLDEHFNIKLADFGFARIMLKNSLQETNCGSYVYTAPEVLDGEKYDGIAADIWSIGVCLYCMLSGKLPFRDDDIDILRYSILEELKFPRHISRDCRKLLHLMINRAPASRPSIPAILKHIWMCKPLKSTREMSLSAISIETMTENHVPLDPTTEHGFTCDQFAKSTRPSRVKDVLGSVAEVHSSGGSSVDLTKVANIKKDSVAALTGVTGPVGRRISEQLLTPVTPDKNPLMPKSLGGGSKFSKAVKTMKKFKVVAKAVTAATRFRRGPLDTILNMPQDKAMVLITEKHIDNIEHEKKGLHNCLSGKVAKLCQEDKHIQVEYELQPIRERKEKEKIQQEKKDLLCSTMSHLLPAADKKDEIDETGNAPYIVELPDEQAECN